MVPDTVAVNEIGTGDQAFLVDGERADPGAGDKHRAGSDRVRPVGQVSTGLCAGGAAGLAGAVTLAGGPVAEGTRGNGVGGRPPVPTEFVHAARRSQAGLADRQRRQRKGVRVGVRRVALQARDAHVVSDLVVERAEILVGEWPVLGHPVESLDSEVRGEGADPMP